MWKSPKPIKEIYLTIAWLIKDLAEKCITYFNDRISNIRKYLEKIPIATSQTLHDIFNNFDGEVPKIPKFMGPTWGPPGYSGPKMGPMLAPWTLLSGAKFIYRSIRGWYRIYVGYMAFKPSDVTCKYDAIFRIEACVTDIRIWVNDYFFKLNYDKTELLMITTCEKLSKISDISVKVGDQSILPGDEPPRILGLIFDSTCCLDAHIAKLCRSNNFNLYSVGRIRKYLDKPTAE